MEELPPEPRIRRRVPASETGLPVEEVATTLGSDGKPYEVGYGKPPKEHQFVSGICPNRKGRGKKTRNKSTILNDILEETLEIREDGRRRKLRKLDLIYRQLVADAIKGKPGARAQLLSMLPAQIVGNIVEQVDIVTDTLDQAIISEYLKRAAPQ